MDEVILKIKTKDRIGPINFDIEPATKQEIKYYCYVHRHPKVNDTCYLWKH